MRASQALAVQITDPTVGWTSELVTAWSRFIVGIHLRHPDSMPELRAGAAAQWEADGDKYQAEYEKIRKPTDPATFDEYIAIRDPLVKTKMQLNLIIKALDNEFICSHINQMQWTVADFSHAGMELLVSDRPVEIHALAVPKGIVTIPLTPTKLFIAVNDPASLPMIQKRPAREVIERINLSLVSRARRYVWARDNSQREFIEANMSNSMDQSPFYPQLQYSVRTNAQPFFRPSQKKAADSKTASKGAAAIFRSKVTRT
jgi:Protein of unknown function (DUF4238)